LLLWHNKLWLIHSLTKKNIFISVINLQTSLPNVFEFCPAFWQIKLLRMCFHQLHPKLLIHCSKELDHKICFDKIDSSLKIIIESFYLLLLLTTYWKLNLLNFKTKRTALRPTSGFNNLLVSSEKNETKREIWGILKIQIIKTNLLISRSSLNILCEISNLYKKSTFFACKSLWCQPTKLQFAWITDWSVKYLDGLKCFLIFDNFQQV